jgi:hypothetical protein
MSASSFLTSAGKTGLPALFGETRRGENRLMKRYHTFLALFILLLTMALGASATLADPAGETPPFPTYGSVIYPCRFQYSDATKVWSAGNSMHGRDIGYISVGETDDGRYQVRVIEKFNWDINVKSLEGNLRGTITQEYTDQSGTVGYWVGTIEGRLHGEFIDIDAPQPLEVWFGEGKGVFEGQGLFEGLRMKSAWRQELHLDQPADACAADMPAPGEEPWPVKTLIDHYVIETTGSWPADN